MLGLLHLYSELSLSDSGGIGSVSVSQANSFFSNYRHAEAEPKRRGWKQPNPKLQAVFGSLKHHAFQISTLSLSGLRLGCAGGYEGSANSPGAF